MLNRTIATFAAASILCVACATTEAMAYRGGYRGGGVGVGGYHGGAYRGGAYRGAYVRRGVGAAAVGAAAVGAAVAAPYYSGGYYNSAACGYYPNSALQLSCIATRTRRLRCTRKSSALMRGRSLVARLPWLDP